jgi:Fe-S-cluster containining protein
VAQTSRVAPGSPRARTIKDRLFTACAQKSCCEVRIVAVTGRDAVRIASALATSVSTVCTAVPADPDDPDAFALGRHGAPHRLVLPREHLACSFLLRLPEGSGRCGLDELRPMACLTYPFTLRDGFVRAPESEPCACRAWSLADADPEQERSLLEAAERERDEYRQVLSRWPDDPGDRSFGAFCEFLVDAYTPA